MIIVAVRIHILSQEGNLNKTICYGLADFCNDAFHTAAALPPTGKRNNAKRTEFITAAHN